MAEAAVRFYWNSRDRAFELVKDLKSGDRVYAKKSLAWAGFKEIEAGRLGIVAYTENDHPYVQFEGIECKRPLECYPSEISVTPPTKNDEAAINWDAVDHTDNVKWIAENGHCVEGAWIALRRGKLVAFAPDHQTLQKYVEVFPRDKQIFVGHIVNGKFL